jgi:hypothetical protein
MTDVAISDDFILARDSLAGVRGGEYALEVLMQATKEIR